MFTFVGRQPYSELGAVAQVGAGGDGAAVSVHDGVRELFAWLRESRGRAGSTSIGVVP